MPSLSEQINNYAGNNPVRFHMPGHKGVFDPLDLTELFFTDNLYSPDENLRIISDLETRVTQVFFARSDIKSSISCGGATLGIQAALLAALRVNNIRINNINDKKYIICARDCHVSFINALALLDIEPLWVYGNFCGVFKRHANKNIIAAFITAPDYYGSLRDVRETSQICKKYNAPLIVDNSHGSHLAFYKGGGFHPINCGADISVDSVHKTLPALTGGAVIHARPEYNIREALKIFASTSPSFLILQSIEKMLDFLESDGTAEHSRLLQDITGLKNNAPEFFLENYKSADPFRIILNCADFGEKLYYFLFGHNITCEFYEKDRVILIPSIFNKPSDFKVLADALQTFALENKIMREPVKIYNFAKPERALSLSDAVKSPRELVKTSACTGRICAESIFAYPPGVPVILPGETIDAETIKIIKNLRDKIYIIKS